MPGRKPSVLPEVDMELLSPQQKAIYNMALEGVRPTRIAEALGVKTSQVTSQLCRIRKKALAAENAYTKKPGAEHALNINKLLSPAEELKEKMCKDPGFFSLLRKKYGTDEPLPREDSIRLAAGCSGRSGPLSGRIKILSASGKNGRGGRVVVKLGRPQKKKAAQYLRQKKIYAVETRWDDGSSLFIVNTQELKGLDRELRCPAVNNDLRGK